MKAIHHIGVSVANLEEAIDFYHDVLGLEFSREPSPVFDDPNMGPAIGVPGAALRQACFQCGDAQVELQEYTAPDPPNRAPPPPNAIGAAHIAFRVSDIEAAKRALEEKGIRFLSDVNVVDEGTIAGWRWVYFHDPAGNTLELLEEAYVLREDRAAGIAGYKSKRKARATEAGAEPE